MDVLMRITPCSSIPSARIRGFTLVEALAALAIFTMAVLIAAAFLQAHVQAARRLEVRSALVRASETALEEIRGGLRPLVSSNANPNSEIAEHPGREMVTSIKVDSGGVPDLYRVVVTSKSATAGRPMEVSLETMVWRP